MAKEPKLTITPARAVCALCIAALLLPGSAAYGLSWDVDYELTGYVSVRPGDTLNLLPPGDGTPGAKITGSLYVFANETGYGTLNIYYADAQGTGSITITPPSDTVPTGGQVTVYGSNFAWKEEPVEFGQLDISGGGQLTGTFEGNHTCYLTFTGSEQPITLVQANGGGGPIEVEIAIRPGSDSPSPINPGSNGLVPVAIFTTDYFDATTVDPATVTLAGREVATRGKANKLMSRHEDVDGDGNLDLLVHIEIQSDGEEWATGPVELLGETFDGDPIVGYDYIVIVPREQ